MKLTKTQKLELYSQLLGLIIEGKSGEEISDEMGLSQLEVEGLRRELVEKHAESLQRKPIEHVYAEYVIEQTQNIHDLTKIIVEWDKDSKSLSGVVGAIRARSDIADKIVQHGQKMGVLKQKVVDGSSIDLGDLTTEELVKRIAEQHKKTALLVEKNQDRDFIDIPIGSEIHYGPSLKDKDKKVKKKKRKRSAAN